MTDRHISMDVVHARPMGYGPWRFGVIALRSCAVFCLSLMVAVPGWAVELKLPVGAHLSREITEVFDSFSLAIGPYAAGTIPVIATEGRVTRQAWRLESRDATTLQMLAPLRTQIEAAGYRVVFECQAQACGGFDFRFNADVLPAPDMYVDLFDYRYLAAREDNDDGPPDVISVMISRSEGAGYVQINRVMSGAGDEVVVAETAQPDPQTDARPVGSTPVPKGPLAEQLLQHGHVILGDLEFDSGSSSLADRTYDSLQALQAFLKEDPDRRVALVGHTDTVGGLESNVTLSRRRAASVLERLVSDYDIPRGQLEAGGMGYLSPIASNLTAQGRETNRRVEAVLLNHE